ncbi:MAG: F0F1 ATP synthase subunit beta, partial [Chloroflexota bacterium]|nr:F0F1 ATP synthase subunit beta [Chloroflexota bacterium]
MALGTVGHVVQVIGTVVDVEFPSEGLPAVHSAVAVDLDGEELVLEVQQHLGNSWVRCLALGPTEGLSRGAEAVDRGEAVSVPVGRGSLGRLFNVLGEPLDGLGEVPAEERWPIHREPPAFEEQETSTSMLETGIKVIDLICPYAR